MAGCDRKIVRIVGTEIISNTSVGPSVHAISRPKSDEAVEAGAASPTREEKTNTARMNATITIAKMIASHTVTWMYRLWIHCARSDFGASVVMGRSVSEHPAIAIAIATRIAIETIECLFGPRRIILHRLQPVLRRSRPARRG